MKKILLTIIFLLITNVAQAGIISYDSFDSATTIQEIQDAVNRIYIDHNGNITTENLAEGAVASNDIATVVNPLARDFHHIGEYVYSG